MYYLSLGGGAHSETLEPLEVYRALYVNEISSLWVRPHGMFHGPADGGEKRFQEEAIQLRLRQRVQSDVDKQTIARGITQALQNTHKQYARYGTWGAMHEHHIQHILGRLPIIGSRFRFEKFEAPGSSDTLYKSANTFSLEPHSVSYGAQARFIAELDEPDENYFVLLGGQDGWIRSENFLDQIPLWKAGEYMRLPLSSEGVRKSFPWTTEITTTKITTTKASSENLNKE